MIDLHYQSVLLVAVDKNLRSKTILHGNYQLTTLYLKYSHRLSCITSTAPPLRPYLPLHHRAREEEREEHDDEGEHGGGARREAAERGAEALRGVGVCELAGVVGLAGVVELVCVCERDPPLAGGRAVHGVRWREV